MADLTDMFCVLALSVIGVSYALIMFLIWRKYTHFYRVRMDTELCYTCCENMATIVLLHCGHGGLCHACVKHVLNTNRRCPLCRSEINGMVFRIMP